MPKRIQRKRTKGWRMPEGAVYVGRPTIYGNPFEVGGIIEMIAYRPGEARSGEFFTRQIREARVAVEAFRLWVLAKDMGPIFAADLAGKDLACWCPLEDEHGNPVPCHADLLLEIANEGARHV